LLLSQPSFRIFVPLTGAFIEKGTYMMIVEGLAQTTETGPTGKRMAACTIKAMAASNLARFFSSEHRPDWDSELGSVTSLIATADHQSLMRSELDPAPHRSLRLRQSVKD
jgi:hypothetical protein